MNASHQAGPAGANDGVTSTPSRPGSGSLVLRAPLSGIVVPLDRVPDPVFAQRLAGDGVSIDPTSSILLAPCDGSVTQVHRAGHAVTLRTSHGLEIMMHIGLDTVELGGRGFTPHVRTGQQVHTGEALIAFDADYVATHARSLLTAIIVTNMDRVARLTVGAGLVTAARDVVLSVVPLGGLAAGAPEPFGGEFLRSGPVVVAAGSGLHARPAAVVAARARSYAAEVRSRQERTRGERAKRRVDHGARGGWRRYGHGSGARRGRARGDCGNLGNIERRYRRSAGGRAGGVRRASAHATRRDRA